MQDRITNILQRHLIKIDETIRAQEEMKEHKQKTFDEIQSYFTELQARLQQRQEQLLKDY